MASWISCSIWVNACSNTVLILNQGTCRFMILDQITVVSLYHIWSPFPCSHIAPTQPHHPSPFVCLIMLAFTTLYNPYCNAIIFTYSQYVLLFYFSGCQTRLFFHCWSTLSSQQGVLYQYWLLGLVTDHHDFISSSLYFRKLWLILKVQCDVNSPFFKSLRAHPGFWGYNQWVLGCLLRSSEP